MQILGRTPGSVSITGLASTDVIRWGNDAAADLYRLSAGNLKTDAAFNVATSILIGDGTGIAATMTFNISATATSGMSLRYRIAGVEQWRMYMAGLADPHLYVRDMINARMHVTYTMGSSSTAAQTEFASQVLIDGPLKALAGFNVKEGGTDARMGTATLVGGSAVVATTSVTATSRIFVLSNTDGGTPGWIRVSARTAGTSFTITSSSGTDTSTVAWLIVEPA